MADEEAEPKAGAHRTVSDVQGKWASFKEPFVKLRYITLKHKPCTALEALVNVSC